MKYATRDSPSIKALWHTYRGRIWWGFVGLMVGITPYLFEYADRQRVIPGTGSEAWIVPALLFGWAILKYWNRR